MQPAVYRRMQPAYCSMQDVNALRSGVDAGNDTVVQWSRPHHGCTQPAYDGMQAARSGAPALRDDTQGKLKYLTCANTDEINTVGDKKSAVVNVEHSQDG